MSDLHDAVDAAVSAHPKDDEWVALCIATVRLARAAADWDAACKAYAVKHPRTPVTDGPSKRGLPRK